MLSLLFGLVIVSQRTSMIPDTLIDFEAYKDGTWKHEGVNNDYFTSVSYRRGTDGSTVHCRARTIQVEELIEDSWIAMTRNAIDLPQVRIRKTPSNRHLGDRSRWSNSSGTLILHAMSDRNYVLVQIEYRGANIRPDGTWRMDDPEGDIEMLEGAARHALARITASTMTNGSNANVAGHVVTGTLRDGQNRIFVPLDGWAQARGITLNTNIRAGTVSFIFAGQTAVIALACSEWTHGNLRGELGGIVVLKNNKWYAPLNALQNAFR